MNPPEIDEPANATSTIITIIMIHGTDGDCLLHERFSHYIFSFVSNKHAHKRAHCLRLCSRRFTQTHNLSQSPALIPESNTFTYALPSGYSSNGSSISQFYIFHTRCLPHLFLSLSIYTLAHRATYIHITDDFPLQLLFICNGFSWTQCFLILRQQQKRYHRNARRMWITRSSHTHNKRFSFN